MASLRSMQYQLGIVSQLLAEMMVESKESNDVALSNSDDYHSFTEQTDFPAIHDEDPFFDGNYVPSTTPIKALSSVAVFKDTIP
ncbi:hypothetical protein A2U01_0057521, partial [Trifolium medium]|nr:hypothetical protein [Trifolium medium]